MGRKVHPKIFRIGHTTDWLSKWFSGKKSMPKFLSQDIKAREYLAKKIERAGIDQINIERHPNKITINMHSARPGVIIGRGGEGIENLIKDLRLKIFKREKNLEINIKEVKNPFLSAGIVLENMVADTEKRTPFRRVMKNAADQVKKAGAKGVKLMVSGRLNGAEIARSEKISWGKVPLHTMRADIDYAYGIARTIYGAIGIKVWIYRGEVFENDNNQEQNKVVVDNQSSSN
jgi:small subunit ribosomal protein S3